MKITEITVSAGRTFNHPYEAYSNLKPYVTLRASVDDTEDVTETTRHLQGLAEDLVEDHKQMMLASIEKLRDMEMRGQEVACLSRSLREAQARLDQIRKQYPELPETAEDKVSDGPPYDAATRTGMYDRDA